MKFIDLEGLKFGRLTVGKAIRGGREVTWECRCDCGGTITTTGGHLRDGDTTSCGCVRREMTRARGKANLKHGHNQTNSSSYRSWVSMWNRCTNRNDPNWTNYGARGITACERWRNFEVFLADMGERSSGTSIDRINNAGNYEPDNCRWATAAQQNGNRKSSLILEHDGRRQSLAAWAREVGLSPQCVSMRLRAGWTVADALKRRKTEKEIA